MSAQDTILKAIHSTTFSAGTVSGLVSHSLQLAYYEIPTWVYIFAAATPTLFIIAFTANQMFATVAFKKATGFALAFHLVGATGLLFAALEMLSENKLAAAATRLNLYGSAFLVFGSISLVYLSTKKKVSGQSKIQFLSIIATTVLLLVSGILAYYTTYLYRIFSFLAFVILIPAAITTIYKEKDADVEQGILHGQPIA